MRLWNGIVAGRLPVHVGDVGTLPKQAAIELANAPVVVVDEVAGWVDANYNALTWLSVFEQACARPPFPRTLLEWRTPSIAMAAAVETIERSDGLEVTMAFGIELPDGRGLQVDGGSRFFVDRTGALFRPGGDGGDPRDPSYQGCGPLVEVWPVDGMELGSSDDPRSMALGFLGVSAVAIGALTFMNCRNVVLRERDTAKQKKAFERRQGCKPARYYTLDIGPLRKAVGGEMAVGSGISLAKALHLCRGHFKEFTEEKKLFGRLTGRFWWAPQVRGTAEAGVVTKDYRVHPLDVSAAGGSR